jgi:TolB-like protein
MKKESLFTAIFLVAIINTAYAQVPVTIDQAIRSSAEQIEARLARDTRVVVLSFDSPSERLSRYILDEMMTVFVNNHYLSVVDRAHIELIQREMAFQMSGDVSDDSAQRIGQLLGAQSIITGSIEDLGPHYVIRFRTIGVETAAVQVLSRIDVRKDIQIANLMGQPGITSTPNALTYSTAIKVGAGFGNFLFGIGSFIMGDWVGGLIVAGLQVAGVITAVLSEDDRGNINETMMATGGVLYIGGVAYGFARPFAYDRSLARRTAASHISSNPMNNIILAPVPTRGGGLGFAAMYRASF